MPIVRGDGYDGYDEYDEDVSGAGTAGLVIVRISHNDVTVSVDTSGEPLYRACGYGEIERTTAAPVGGVIVPLIRMGKTL